MAAAVAALAGLGPLPPALLALLDTGRVPSEERAALVAAAATPPPRFVRCVPCPAQALPELPR